MTADDILQILPNAGSNAGVFVDEINAACEEFEIDTPRRQAAFIATCGHESQQLNRVSENLNYSAQGLLRTFPRYFTSSQAAVYARNPERIANRVYANRMGNGDESSGDGWRYRGAGLIQVTGHDNQQAVADHFGIPRQDIGDWLRTPEGAARSAAYYWQSNGLNELADKDRFREIQALVNTGNRRTPENRIIGWDDRLALYERALMVLGA
jgi:putative chitinase